MAKAKLKIEDLGFDPEEMTRRAFSAYYRSSSLGFRKQPSADCSGWEEHGGLHYIVLRNTTEILAVYRIQNNQSLRRMIRPPAAIEATP